MKKILLVGLLGLLFSFKHPFYLSVTNLKYNLKESALQGSVKLFINDIEDALKRTQQNKVDLINPKDSIKTQTMLEEYLKKRLYLSVNNVKKNFQVLGFEREQEAVWIYIEVKDCKLPKNISIENSLLYDFIKNQSNIIHVEVNEQKKSLKLNNPEKLAVFEF
ncbi:DUF6702 family protein [Aurantibacillus circumpalustris]|uniref:DUF6702 family protein n=1 Tax=Aurantibacillus circumpalustris TaxID=3036359 RepID=UPI00295BEEC4|nr:DUF6702 family protein [Aurantibacillus circumpalustris]